MARYRGKAFGRTRGPYQKVELEAVFSRPEYDSTWGVEMPPQEKSPFVDVWDYLSRFGLPVATYSEPDPPVSKQAHASVHHYAGATVKTRYAHDLGSYERFSHLALLLISNDPMEDVLEKLSGKFPYLKRKER